MYSNDNNVHVIMIIIFTFALSQFSMIYCYCPLAILIYFLSIKKIRENETFFIFFQNLLLQTTVRGHAKTKLTREVGRL